MGLPHSSSGLNSIWVIVDRLTKLAPFLSVHTSYSAERLACIYIQEVVCLHGVPISTILNRGYQFTSSFGRTFQEELGIHVDLRITFHLQTNRQSERTIQIDEDMLQDKLRTAQSRHQSYVDHRHQPLRFVLGDRILLCISLVKGVIRFGRQGKLSPRYIGPFEIVRTVGEAAYELALPSAFISIHPIFHVLMLRQYIPNESHVIQYDTVDLDDHLSYIKKPVVILARDVRQLHYRAILVVKVHWRHFLVEEDN
ncbi:uncharacterized protein LOC129893500 [Solanum dulcamara]|uniref:uncharacterized protein LOC129893500 n=1 Tax=Solanum dulcamara TaxID=45834 RepID=UPI0024854C54|nr:uncharacterized protein LOC129893500 [Solanum dulcamara]